MKKIFILLFLMQSLALWSNCQWKHISTPEGLSNRRVYNSTKDHKGYIWFATRNSIDRFDGREIRSYALSNNEKIRGVIANKKGEIYTFTSKSLYHYDERKDAFISIFFTHHHEDETLRNKGIAAIHFSKSNTCYIGIYGGLLSSQDMVNWKLHKDFKKEVVRCFESIDSTRTLIGTRNGIYLIDEQEHKELHEIESIINQLKKKPIESLYMDSVTNMLWIGTFRNGLIVYDLNKKQFTYKSKKNNKNPIRSISPLNAHTVWVGYDGIGIEEYDRTSARITNHYLTTSNKIPLPSNGIYNIFKDKDNIWISTYTNGLLWYNNKGLFKQHFQRLSSRNTIDTNQKHVNALLEDSRGNLWVGTNQGAYVYIKNKEQYFDNESPHTRHYLPNATILSIFEDSDGDVWVSGYTTELLRINKAFKAESVRWKGIENHEKKSIYSIFQDHESNLWFGGINQHLVKYDKKTKLAKTFPLRGIHKICEYDKDSLLIGCIGGIVILNQHNGKHRRPNATLNNKETIRPFVNNIVQDKAQSSIFWISTDNYGLLRWDSKHNTWREFTKKQGLPSDAVYGILFDDEYNLWLSTESGISCLKNLQTEPSAQNYLLNETFNFLAYEQLANNNILFGSPNGVVEFNTNALLEDASKHPHQFNLHFTDFRIFYNRVLASDEDSPLSCPIDECTQIRLPHDKHSFSFEFANVVSQFEQKSHYQWKLEGFDKDWIKSSTSNNAIYTNIPPGKYRFHVRTLLPNLNTTSPTRTIDIVITPPFWASHIAYLLYICLLIAIIYLAITYYHNKLEKKNADEKVNFFVNMAHDIRIPITLVKAPLNELEGEETLSASGRNALTIAQRNINKLFKLVTELLDFQRMAIQGKPLRLHEVEINSYIKNTCRGFALLASEKKVEFEQVLLNEAQKVWIDEDKITVVIENLLSNAIKYTPQKGCVRLTLTLNEKDLTITVVDSGIGIPKKSQKKLFTPFFRAANAIESNEVGSGIGLLLTKKLIEQHHGRLSYTSREEEGSTFKVELPYTRESYHETEIDIEATEQTLIEEHIENNDNHLTILLVEDNDELRNYLGTYLRRSYKVEEAHDGIEALEIIKRNAPDMIISDILMPRLKGTELCQQVKNNIETCHIPFVLLTSLSEREDVIAGLATGADNYITKPFDLPIFESKIKNLINNRRLARKKYIDPNSMQINHEGLTELDKEFLEKVVQLINDNMTNEELNIDYIAGEMAMSRSVFFKKVKALTDQSPKDLIKDIKMKHAASLLIQQRESIAEIAYQTGFPDAKYFSTAFKKYFGISPTNYIEKKRSENKNV